MPKLNSHFKQKRMLEKLSYIPNIIDRRSESHIKKHVKDQNDRKCRHRMMLASYTL